MIYRTKEQLISSRKKHGRSKAFPWPILAFGGVLLVTAAFLFAGRGTGETGLNGTPSIKVDQQKIDYGEVKLNMALSFTIRVTNTGDGGLRFRETPYIEVLEGC